MGADQLHPDVQIELHTGVAAEMDRKLGSIFDLVINISRQGTGNGVLLQTDDVHWVTSSEDSPHRRDPLPLACLPQGSLYRQWAVEALARIKRPWVLAQESSNIAAIEASIAAGLAVGVFQKSSIARQNLRRLTEKDGFPKLPRVDIRLLSAERYLPRAAIRLHTFLCDRLHPDHKAG